MQPQAVREKAQTQRSQRNGSEDRKTLAAADARAL